MTEQTYNRVISWKTTKLDWNSFQWVVYSFDYGVERVIHATGIAATREQATGAAKRATRYHKAQQAAQATPAAVAPADPAKFEGMDADGFACYSNVKL